MNAYITLDGKKYATVFGAWMPARRKPSMIRKMWDGTTDVTYGPGVFKEWRGLIRAPVTVLSGWGSITNIRVTLDKTEGVSFTDHYGDTYTVHVLGELTEDSFTPAWDGPSNVFHIPVRLVAE